MVEFVGLPGSGKSTLSHALADLLRRAGEGVTEVTYDITHRSSAWRRRGTKLVLCFATLLRHPRQSLAIALEVGRSRQRSAGDYATTTFHLLYLCGLRERLARRPGIHLLDQGVFNALASVRFSASADRSLRPLCEGAFRSGPATGLVVFVEVRPETAVERMTGRARVQSRLETRLHTDAFPTMLAAACAALAETRAVASACRRRPGRDGLEIVSLANDDACAIESNAAQLAARVLQARSTRLETPMSSPSSPLRQGVAREGDLR